MESRNNRYHPYLIIYEALNQGLSICSQLREVIDRKFFIETGKSLFAVDLKFLNGDVAGTTEWETLSKVERNRLKTIGILVHMLADVSREFKRKESISAKVIREKIVEFAENFGIDEFGLKTIDRDISQAVKYLKDTVPADTN